MASLVVSQLIYWLNVKHLEKQLENDVSQEKFEVFRQFLDTSFPEQEFSSLLEQF